MLSFLNNPYIQGLSINLMTLIIQDASKKLFSYDLREQYKIVIQNTFDNLSNEYPMRSAEEGISYWDFLAERVIIESNDENINIDKAKKAIRVVIDELGIDLKEEQEMEEVYSDFWRIFCSEVVKHDELYRYLVMSYITNSSDKKILEIVENIHSLLTTTGIQKNVVDIKAYEEEIINYIISLQLIYIKEIVNDFIDREFTILEDPNDASLNNTDIIKHHENYLILGEPGSGKTYTIKRILYETTLIEDTKVIDKIPVFLNLSAYGSTFSTIVEGIFMLLRKYIPDITLDDVHRLVNDGKFIILLDGLDEVNQEYYESCIEEIKGMLTHSVSNKYIITCRTNIYHGELSYLVEQVRLKLLSRDQVSNYLQKYCGLSPTQIANDQYDLFENPLLLRIGVDVINNYNGEIPNNRSVMLNNYIEYLSYKWERLKGLKRKYELSYYEVIELLSKVAFKEFESPYLEKYTLQKLIKEEYPDKSIESIFEQIINMGVFEYRYNEEIWFVHKTFKEYFAARFIVENIKELEDYVLDSIISRRQWYEVFIFTSGLFTKWKEQDEFFEYILERNLQLYIDCVKGRNDFNKYLLSLESQEFLDKYLGVLLTSYERIIDKYFPQIKSQFNPFHGQLEFNKNSRVGILGCFSEDRKHFNYSLIMKKSNEEKISCISSNKFEEHHRLAKSKKYQSNFINLELADLMGDSARTVALKEIKGNIDSILKERRLIENRFLLCERVEEAKQKLRIMDIEDLKDIFDWTQSKIEEVEDMIGEKIDSYKYNGVELVGFNKVVRSYIDKGIDYKECLLPIGDVSNNVNWIWDFYSRDRMIERVEKFFYFYQVSFIELVDENFNNLKTYLPDYINLPYKYIVEIEFKDEPIRDYFSQPELCYYYYGTDSYDDNFPEIKLVEKKDSSIDKLELIRNSFKERKGETNNLSVCNTFVSMTLKEGSTGRNLPLLSKTYELLKENLEHLFGRF